MKYGAVRILEKYKAICAVEIEFGSQNICQEVSLYSGCCRGVLTAMSHRMFVKRFHCILAVAEGCLLL